MKNFKRKKQQNKIIKLNVNPDELKQIVCGCGHDVFVPAARIKKISALISPDGQEKYLQIPVSVCLKCNAVLPEKP